MADEKNEPFWKKAVDGAGKFIKKKFLHHLVMQEIRQKASRYETLPPDQSSAFIDSEIHAWAGTNAIFRSYKTYSVGIPRKSGDGLNYLGGAMFVVWGKGESGKTFAINALAHCSTPCLPSRALSLHLHGSKDPYTQILDMLNFRRNMEPTAAAMDLYRAVSGQDDRAMKQVKKAAEKLASGTEM